MGPPSPGAPGAEARSIAISPTLPPDTGARGQKLPTGDRHATNVNSPPTAMSRRASNMSKKKTSSFLTGEEATYSPYRTRRERVGIGTDILRLVGEPVAGLHRAVPSTSLDKRCLFNCMLGC
jgi:hypothetical protein